MRPQILTCQELVELVTDYLEDGLPLGERMRFEEHLAICGPCRIYLQQMRETIRLTGALSQEQLAPEAKETLLDAFRDWKR